MTLEALSAWVLGLMLACQPKAPWRASYEATAQAIARASSASPVFEGERGAEKTAALLTSIAWFESAFDPRAGGDKRCLRRDGEGRCIEWGAPTSHCLLQINESNFAGLGTTAEELGGSVDRCVALGLRLVRASFRVCAARPLDERIAWYAGGGDGCPEGEDAVRKSRHRVAKALWLFKTRPPPPQDLAPAE